MAQFDCSFLLALVLILLLLCAVNFFFFFPACLSICFVLDDWARFENPRLSKDSGLKLLRARIMVNGSSAHSSTQSTKRSCARARASSLLCTTSLADGSSAHPSRFPPVPPHHQAPRLRSSRLYLRLPAMPRLQLRPPLQQQRWPRQPLLAVHTPLLLLLRRRTICKRSACSSRSSSGSRCRKNSCRHRCHRRTSSTNFSSGSRCRRSIRYRRQNRCSPFTQPRRRRERQKRRLWCRPPLCYRASGTTIATVLPR